MQTGDTQAKVVRDGERVIITLERDDGQEVTIRVPLPIALRLAKQIIDAARRT